MVSAEADLPVRTEPVVAGHLLAAIEGPCAAAGLAATLEPAATRPVSATGDREADATELDEDGWGASPRPAIVVRLTANGTTAQAVMAGVQPRPPQPRAARHLRAFLIRSCLPIYALRVLSFDMSQKGRQPTLTNESTFHNFHNFFEFFSSFLFVKMKSFGCSAVSVFCCGFSSKFPHHKNNTSQKLLSG